MHSLIPYLLRVVFNNRGSIVIRFRLSYLLFYVIVLTASTACSTPVDVTTPDGPLNLIKLPPGFKISIYAGNVPNARAMVLSPNGTLFVGSMGAGNVYALQDLDNDNQVDTLFTVARGLNMPCGVAFRDGSLYVSAVTRILRYDNIEVNLRNPPEPVVINDTFPDAHHGWKFIAFGPDGKLYVPVGAPCNVCNKEPEDSRFASIMRMNPDGSGLEVFASGVRNTVGFDWRPGTQDLWFTDNGRDQMGNDIPPDELNHAPSAGLHFGFPFHHGTDIPDPDFGALRAKETTVSPVQTLGPHVAALGMRFYTGTMFPEAYRGHIFIAEHGSWNRDDPIGYRVTQVKLDDSSALNYDVFAEGWLQGGESWGRPADVLVMPDGALLVSDDKAGAIYRISYED